MSGSDDSQDDLREREVDLSPGTSPDAISSCPEEPGTPSSHGLPKAATRARKKLNSDEEDSDFVPEEVLAKKQDKVAKKSANEATSSRRTVSKVYASSEAMRAPASARTRMALHLESPPKKSMPKKAGEKKRASKRIAYAVGRQTSMFEDPEEAAGAAAEEEEEHIEKAPPKKKKILWLMLCQRLAHPRAPSLSPRRLLLKSPRDYPGKF